MEFYEQHKDKIERLEKSLGICIVSHNEKTGISLFLLSYNDFAREFQHTGLKTYTEALKRYNKMAEEFFSFDVTAITNKYRYLPSTPENYARLGDEIERAAIQMLAETGSKLTLNEYIKWLYRRWFVFEEGENL